MRFLPASKFVAAALGVMIVILVAIIAWAVASLVAETRLRATERTERDWAVIQLDFETLRMANAFTEYRFQRDPDSLDELLLRADIVYSRLSMFEQGIVAEALAGREDMADLSRTIRSTLLDVEAVALITDDTTLASAAIGIEALRAKAYDASVMLLLDSNRSLAALEDRLRSMWYWIAVPLMALLVVGGALVILLTRAVKHETLRREEANAAQRAALAAEQMLSNAMTAMSDGLMIATPDGRIAVANRRIDELLPDTVPARSPVATFRPCARS
ncbi:hypothetical protein ACFQ4K_04250 [Tistrella bauzanensis]